MVLLDITRLKLRAGNLHAQLDEPTRVQTTQSGGHAIGTVVRKLFAESIASGQGIHQHLYKGAGPAMMRGVPANAVLFVTYETIIDNWGACGF